MPKEGRSMDHTATTRHMYDLLSAGDTDGFATLLVAE
jgi:hypothetical protein